MLDRDDLSSMDRIRRSLYAVLRDELERILIHLSLIDSYQKFREQNQPYPFVEIRDLKTRARSYDIEFDLQIPFLVIFCEGTLPPQEKKFIRFFDDNKVTKENLALLKNFSLSQSFYPNLRHFNSPHFSLFLKDLVPVDYALLIQRDPSVRSRHRYMLSHFRVKIDWPIAEAAEAMGKQLRYISKNLYENCDKYAEILQEKLFELHGFHHTVGGRRTAAAVGFQYLRKFPFLSTVYVSSSEARTLSRLSERGVSRFVLILMNDEEMRRVAKSAKLSMEHFTTGYLVDRAENHGVGIFQVVYGLTEYSRPPADGKLRSLNPDYHWLTINKQQLIPLPTNTEASPLPFSRVYSL